MKRLKNGFQETINEINMIAKLAPQWKAMEG